MPILRYRCKKCGKEFQVFQRITDSPLKKCSFCEGKVDLIPVPLFHNTPSFSLAFVEKEEEKPKEIKAVAKNKKVSKISKSSPVKTEKIKTAKKTKKPNKIKKRKK